MWNNVTDICCSISVVLFEFLPCRLCNNDLTFEGSALSFWLHHAMQLDDDIKLTIISVTKTEMSSQDDVSEKGQCQIHETLSYPIYLLRKCLIALALSAA